MGILNSLNIKYSVKDSSMNTARLDVELENGKKVGLLIISQYISYDRSTGEIEDFIDTLSAKAFQKLVRL